MSIRICPGMWRVASGPSGTQRSEAVKVSPGLASSGSGPNHRPTPTNPKMTSVQTRQKMVTKRQNQDRGPPHLTRRKVIRLTIISLVFLSAVFFGFYFFSDIVVKPPQNVNSDSLPGEWAMFRHDSSHTGTTDSSSIVPRGKLKWVFSTGAPIHSSPAVVDGIVCVGSRDHKLYALNAADGAKLWELKVGSWVESSPAIVNGIVYFGANDGRLHALDVHSGEELWKFKAKYTLQSHFPLYF